MAVVGVSVHRTKLVEEKYPAVHADAFLFVKTGPRESSLISSAISSQSGESSASARRGDDQIGRAFDDARAARKRRAKQRDHRQRADLIDLQSCWADS